MTKTVTAICVAVLVLTSFAIVYFSVSTSPETVMLIQRPSLIGDSVAELTEAEGDVSHYKLVPFRDGKVILDAAALAGLPDGKYAVYVTDPNDHPEDELVILLSGDDVTRVEN